MARIAYPDSPDVAELMRRFPPPLRRMNIGRMVSHARTLVAPYYNTYAAVLQSLELDPQLRQLAILRVAERTSAEVCWSVSPASFATARCWTST